MAAASVETPFGRIARGYLWAIVVTTFSYGCFILWMNTGTIASGTSLSNPISDFTSAIEAAIFMAFILAIIVGVITAGSILIPFVPICMAAERLGVRSLWPYIIGGAIIAQAATLVMLNIDIKPNIFSALDWNPLTPFNVQLMRVASSYALSGALGGLVYWWRAGRKAGASAGSMSLS